MDPEVAAALDAIDSTLAGEPVDPQYAEFAELALLLADDRPAIDPAFVHTLDERVSGRFGDAARKAERDAARSSRSSGWSRWLYGGAAVTLAAAVVAVFVFTPGITNHAASSSSSSSSAASTAAASSSSSGGPARELSSPSPSASGSGSGSPDSAASSGASATAAVGQTHGQGINEFGGLWHVASPAGHAIVAAPASTTTSMSSGSGSGSGSSVPGY